VGGGGDVVYGGLTNRLVRNRTDNERNLSRFRENCRCCHKQSYALQTDVSKINREIYASSEDGIICYFVT
jgi:hypothetical protein